MRLCKSYRVNPQSECNERAHRSTLMADKCHPERSVTESKDLKLWACHPALACHSRPRAGITLPKNEKMYAKIT